MNWNHHTSTPAPTPLCAIYEPQVALLSSGMLEADQMEAVHEHLADCAYCQLHLGEYQRLREDVLRLLLGEASGSADAHLATAAVGGYPTAAVDAPVYFTIEQIMRASAEEPPAFLHPRRSATEHPETPRRRLLTSLGAIAAVLLLALLAASLFSALRFLRGPVAEPTPKVQGPFSPYTAAAPGLPCDQNAQASALWSGDQGVCLANPPRTRLVAQGHLLAVMRWDASAYHLPESYQVSVQVTLEGAGTAKLQMDSSNDIMRVIACGPNYCNLDGQSNEACACDTSGPLTLAIVVKGRNESFYVNNTLLGSITEPDALQPASIGLGVSASDPSAQGAQAVFANFAVVAI